MNFESLWRLGCLLGAGVILPLCCLAVFRCLSRAGVPSPPRFEFFTAFGTLGGWLLATALSPSPPGLMLFGFWLFVSLPATLFLSVRLAWRRFPSRWHTLAFGALCIGAGIPILVSVIAAVFFGP